MYIMTDNTAGQTPGPVASTDTHFYDGKWQLRLDKLLALHIQEYDSTTPPPDLAARFQPIHHTYANMILNNGAVDPANKVSPRSLLLQLYTTLVEKKQNYTAPEYDLIIGLALEQLADVSNGACIQGQTSRIFQILAAILGI